MAIAISHDTPARLINLQPLWHRTAPHRLVEKCPADDPLSGWTAWQKYLSCRRRPSSPPFLHGKRPPVRWGRPGEEDRDNSKLQDDIGLSEALQTVESAYKLPSLVGELPGEAWWQLVEQLHD